MVAFEAWWDSTKADATPDTYRGWEQSCRSAWAVAALEERKRWEEALRLTWQMVDPLNPAGAPGSYARGQDTGIVAALTTLRENLKLPNVALSGARADADEANRP